MADSEATSPPSMTLCLATFFWLAVGAAFARYYYPSAGVAVDGAFLVLIMVVMGVMFASIMASRCGGKSSGNAVGKAVVLPWLFMFGPVLAILRLLPGWKQPFSNTFGYLYISNPFVDGKGKLVALFGAATADETIKANPGLLMNEFNATNFDAQIDTFRKERTLDPGHVDAFKNVVRMKDVVAEFMWHLLAGSVAVIASYNILMNQPCS